MDEDPKEGILTEVAEERDRQDEKWGGPEHDDLHSVRDWIGYIRDHNKQALDVGEFRQQMIRVAALAVAAVESYDRNNSTDG